MTEIPDTHAAAASTFTDQKRACVDCDELFTWTAGEQAYYRQKDLSDPKRCWACRRVKKSRWGDRGR